MQSGSMLEELPSISSKRLFLRMATQEDIQEVVRFYTENRVYLTPFYPLWYEEFFNDKSLKLFLFPQSNSTRIIGTINFRNFVRGAAQYCTVGYSVSEEEQGKGYMTEALKAATDYVFQELNMHRIMANYMPRNQRSGNLLKKLGFVVEGYARDYLMINGKWEDHILTSLIKNF
jgi:[ribosomal protein S5]-alanine N-acetyltransferase